MYYSLIGILALFILVITNHDVLMGGADPSSRPVLKAYRRFLFGVIAYHVTDVLWGVLEAFSLTPLLFIDTEVYFVAMALGILLWTRYVIAYLDEENAFRTFLYHAGTVFFTVLTLSALVNLFYPLLFWFDDDGVYHAALMRDIILVLQVLILVLASVYALRVSTKTRDAVKSRYRTIGLSGLVMLVFISIQLFFPYLPLYSIAYMLGCCLLRTFVIENEKEEYRRGLESALEKEKQQLQALNSARRVAYTDSLTRVKSKSAYDDFVQALQDRLDGGAFEFAIGVFDCDGLKSINDRFGHDKGNEYLKAASRLICHAFTHSPVFRIGGDEFAVVLQGEDFLNRESILRRFEEDQTQTRVSAANPWERVSVAVGVAVYDRGSDETVSDTARRADQIMYENKRARKGAR